jgi:hypothetical protein
MIVAGLGFGPVSSSTYTVCTILLWDDEVTLVTVIAQMAMTVRAMALNGYIVAVH